MQVDPKSHGKANSVDFLSLPIASFFSKHLGLPRRPVYFCLKLLGLFLFLWAPGLLVTYISGSFFLYLTDWSHLFYDVMVVTGLSLLINLCQQTTSTMDELKTVVHDAKSQRYSIFIQKWNNSSLTWYFLCIITPLAYSICNISFNAVGLLHGPPPPWADVETAEVSLEVVRLNSIYWFFESTFNQIILGIGFNRFIHYLLFINAYGKKFLGNTSIDLLMPDAIEKIKPFQRLVVKSTFFCSLPLTLISLFFFEHLVRKQRISFFQLGGIIVLVSLFVFTLLYQMKWVRQVLLNSKSAALSIIDMEIGKARRKITKDTEAFLTLTNLFTFRDKLKKTHVWAFDTKLISRFFLAILLPILGGAFIQIILERLLVSTFL